MRGRLQPQLPVQQRRGVDEAVAVNAAQSGEAGVFQAGDHAEDARLLRMAELGLEADNVVQRAERIVPAELHHGMGAAAGARVGQPHGLHRAEAQGLRPARRHHLDRQAALEPGREGLPLLELDPVGFKQRLDKRGVAGLVERAVDVVGAAAGRSRLVVAGLEPGDVEVDGIGIDDGRNGVEEGERLAPGERLYGVRKRAVGQRTRGDDDRAPVRQPVDPPALYLDERLGLQRGGDGIGEVLPVHGERAAGGQARAVGAGHDERARPAHLFVQQADGVVLGIVGTEGVGADELRELPRLVGGRRRFGAHLEEHRAHTAPRELPAGLRAGKPAADNLDRGVREGSHGSLYPAPAACCQRLRERGQGAGISLTAAMMSAERPTMRQVRRASSAARSALTAWTSALVASSSRSACDASRPMLAMASACSCLRPASRRRFAASKVSNATPVTQAPSL